MLKVYLNTSSSINIGAHLRCALCAWRSTHVPFHRRFYVIGFSFQEFSQRYAIPTDSFATVQPKLRRQDTENRQNSIDDLAEETVEYYDQRIDDHFRRSVDLYESLLHSGVAKECARSVLPLNTVTRLYMSGTIRSWLHYCDLRCANGTQEEHKQIADSVKEILLEQLPTISHAMWPE